MKFYSNTKFLAPHQNKRRDHLSLLNLYSQNVLKTNYYLQICKDRNQCEPNNKFHIVFVMEGFNRFNHKVYISNDLVSRVNFVAELFSQMARGVGFMHKNGVVHLDLKPKNMRVTTAGNIKIFDFGLSKQFDVRSDFKLDEGDKAFSGSGIYRAPEVGMWYTTSRGLISIVNKEYTSETVDARKKLTCMHLE